MASNTFGNCFRMTTFGESHGKAIGVVIDGCPAGITVTVEDINTALSKRAPGNNAYVSARQESDQAEVISGIFDNKTTGAPIAILIPNKDPDSSKYEPIKHLLRPGHANFTYLEKYGCFDYRGGGRSSARETACRVAVGAVATKLLEHFNIEVLAYLKSAAGIVAADNSDFNVLREQSEKSLIFCPDPKAEAAILMKLDEGITEGDSWGGIVECAAINLPVGLGDPIYEKLEANLAKAMMSLPATKGFEIGEGFQAANMRGSDHNDAFIANKGKISETNHAGGTLAGISTGMPLVFRVAFKPTSSIKKQQKTVDLDGQRENFYLPEGSRHDPCVAIRAVPVVAAMCRVVLADAVLMNRGSTL